MAKLYLYTKRYQQAIYYLQLGLQNAEQANLKYLLYDIHFTFSEVYKQMGDYQSALASYEKYHHSNQPLCEHEAKEPGAAQPD